MEPVVDEAPIRLVTPDQTDVDDFEAGVSRSLALVSCGWSDTTSLVVLDHGSTDAATVALNLHVSSSLNDSPIVDTPYGQRHFGGANSVGVVDRLVVRVYVPSNQVAADSYVYGDDTIGPIVDEAMRMLTENQPTLVEPSVAGVDVQITDDGGCANPVAPQEGNAIGEITNYSTTTRSFQIEITSTAEDGTETVVTADVENVEPLSTAMWFSDTYATPATCAITGVKQL